MSKTYTRQDLAELWGCSLATVDRRIKETEVYFKASLGEISEDDKRKKLYSATDLEYLAQRFSFEDKVEDDSTGEDDFQIEYVEGEIEETSTVTRYEMPDKLALRRLNLQERQLQKVEVQKESDAAGTLAHTVFNGIGKALAQEVFVEISEFKADLVHSAKAGVMQEIQQNVSGNG